VEVTRLLADTSAYAAFMRAHAGVVSLFREADEIVVTPVVLGELHAGFRRGSRLRSNLAKLATFLGSPRVRVVDIDSETSERYALIFDSLRTAGTPLGTNDLWIAASAMQHGLRLVTTDSDFQRVTQLMVDCLPP
jgi:predicted nucleic acid-binding protein